jgi:iron complex transport system substrate-binding protein
LRGQRPKAAFFLLLGILTLTACEKSARGGGGQTPNPHRIEITDSYDRKIQLETLPSRIVSLAPNMSETLFLLGAGELLAGRTDYCDYPPQITAIPTVGSITNPSIEKIISLKPGLIVGSTHFQKETLQALENLKIPVYLGIIHSSYEEVFSMITHLGKLTGKTAEAEKIIASMRQRKTAIEETVKKAPSRPRVYYMISYGEAGDYTAGRGTFISSLIASAGAINAGDDIEGWRYSTEALFHNQPDIILLGKGASPAQLAKTPPYSSLTAVREGRLHEIDNDLIDRIGPRNIEGLEMLAKIFHPGLFP